MSCRIAVLGVGHVGLTTAACFAHLGHDVLGIDVDESRVAELQSGQISFFEEGLSELVEEGLANGRLRFASSLAEGFGASGGSGSGSDESCADILFVCTPTPLHDGRLDVTVTQSAIEAARLHIGPQTVVVIKSTVPVGFTASIGVSAVSNPEFLRVVAEACRADVADVARIMGMDARIGASYLQVGPGWGGLCLPKDSAELAAVGMTIVADARWLNDAQTDRIVAKVMDACGGSAYGRKIAVWGLAFKPGSDDVLESHAMRVVRALRRAGAGITAYDPNASDPETESVETALGACEGAEVLLVFDDQPIPDVTLARALLGWEPSVSLEEGLTRTISWIESSDLY